MALEHADKRRTPAAALDTIDQNGNEVLEQADLDVIVQALHPRP